MTDLWYRPDVMKVLSHQRWKCDLCKGLIDICTDKIIAVRYNGNKAAFAVTHHRCSEMFITAVQRARRTP